VFVNLALTFTFRAFNPDTAVAGTYWAVVRMFIISVFQIARHYTFSLAFRAFCFFAHTKLLKNFFLEINKPTC